MAARTRRISNDSNTRAKIRAGLLMKRLMDHILSDEDTMSQSQVRAALGLLAKVLPDLQSVQMDVTGEVATISREPTMSIEQWQQEAIEHQTH